MTITINSNATGTAISGTSTSSSISTSSLPGYANTTIVRPNNANNYTGGDVVGSSLSSNSAIEFTVGGSAGQSIIITDATLKIGVGAIPSGMTTFKLHLYSSQPSVGFLDNDAWDLPANAGNLYLGNISLTSPTDMGSAMLVSQNSGLNQGFRLTSSKVYGYLVTDGAFTPTANTQFDINFITATL